MENSELIRNKKYCPESWDLPNGLFSSNVIWWNFQTDLCFWQSTSASGLTWWIWMISCFVSPWIRMAICAASWRRIRNTQLEFFQICCLFVCYTKSSPCLPPSLAFVGLNVEKKWGVTNRLSCLCFANSVELNNCGWAKMSPNWPMQRLILTCHSLVCNLQT